MHIRSGKQHCLVGTNAFMTTCCSHQSLHASQLTIWKVTSRLTKKCPFYGKSPHKPIERCLPYGVSIQVGQEVPTLRKSTSMSTDRCLLYGKQLAYFMESFLTRPLKGAYTLLYRQAPCRLSDRCLLYWKSLAYLWKVSMQADWKVLTLWSLYAGWLKGAYIMESLCRLTERCLPYGVSVQADWKVLTLWKVSMQADWKVLTLWSLRAGWLKGAYLMESLHVGWLQGWNGNQAVVQHEFLVQQWNDHCNQYTSLQKNQGSKVSTSVIRIYVISKCSVPSAVSIVVCTQCSK